MILEDDGSSLVERLWSFGFDALPDPIALLDADQRILAVNEAMARALGKEPASLLNQPCYRVVHGTDAPPTSCPFLPMTATRSAQVSEMLEPNMGGLFRVSVVPVLDQSGKVTAALHSARDITEQRATEDALRESERHYRLLAEGTSDVIWTLDLDGRFTYVSPSVEKLRGYTPEEVLQQTLQEAVCPGSLEVCLHGLEYVSTAATTSDEPPQQPVEVEQPCKDGTTVWTEVVAQPILDDEGKAVGILGASRDITARRRAEELLRESEEKYRTLVENSHDLVYIYRGDRCIFANRRVLEVTGYTEDEIAEMDIFSVVHPDDRDRLRDYGAKRMRGEEAPPGYSARIVDRTGKTHWMEFSVKLITFLGQPAVMGVARDITDRVKAEDERIEMERRFQHMQKLESLGVLAGGIAHDFNNLLMAMMGHLDLALEDAPVDSEVYFHVAEAERTAHRAAELTRQMLAYSGRGHFRLEPVDLNELVREMEHLLRSSISKNATFNMDLEEPLPPLLADPAQLEQIFLNLVVNASEALGSERGEIRLATGLVDADRAYLTRCRPECRVRPGRYVFLEVTDTGVGMDAETQQRLFEPFFTTKFTGRGLGLAAVMGIVRGHDGTLLVDSEPGRGTTIRVLLPPSRLSLEQAPSGERRETAAPRTGAQEVSTRPRGKILVVDDEEAVRTVAVRMLGRLGFDALVAADGEDAVSLVASGTEEVACVILDLTMPKLGGLATYQKLRSLRPDLAVILSSGYEQSECGSLPEGETPRFLQKPYSLDQLRTELTEALRNSMQSLI